jgi:peptide/nickel transport system substrate-binding protein
MSKKFVKVLICIMLSLVIALTGCSNGTNNTETPVGPSTGDNTNADTAKKDTLVVGQGVEPSTLDTIATSDNFSVHYQIYDTLVREDNDEDATLIPSLAEEWKVSDDGTEITFFLRKDVKFHNGDTLTAEDVAWTINRAIESPFTTQMTSSMEKAEIIDDNTVKVILKYPYGAALKCFVTPALQIQSKKAYEDNPEEYGMNPVATGPYKVKEWVRGDKIVLEAFPDYWRGEAPIKNLIFKTIPDRSTQVIALEKGELDVLDNNPSQDARQSFIDNPDLIFDECESNAFLNLMLNNGEGYFKDKKVREAVSYAINREDIINGAKDGVGIPLEVVLLQSLSEFPQDLKANSYNPEKAKQLLAEAGYPNGFTVKMKTIDSPTYIKPTEVIQQQLRDVGINIEIEVMERGKYMSDIIANSDFDITFWAIISKVMDADYCQYSLFHSDNMNGNGNYINVNIPELDELLDRGRTSLDPEERKEIYARTCEIINEESLIIPLFINTRTVVYNKDLKGVHINPAYRFYYYDCSWE